ncbi:MAG: energy-coupling factor transporter transmembrane component T [bacterium]
MYLYLDNDTWVHRLHPLVRLAGMVAVFIAAFVVDRPEWLVPLVLGIVALLIGTGSLANIWRLRLLFSLVFVTTLLIWTFFYGPDGQPPLWSWGPIHVSRTAPWFGLGMALKLETFLGAGILFLSVTRIEEFAYALLRLGVPYKLGFTMTMAFRLVPVFVDSAAAVVQAQRCRGLDFERGNLWQRVRRYVPVMVPVFMSALRRADQMAMALEARGFQSNRPRTQLERHTMHATDLAAALVLLGVVVTYLWLWHVGALTIVVPR